MSEKNKDHAPNKTNEYRTVIQCQVETNTIKKNKTGKNLQLAARHVFSWSAQDIWDVLFCVLVIFVCLICVFFVVVVCHRVCGILL